MLTMGIAHRNMLTMGIAHRNMLTMGIAHRNMLTMGIAHRNMLTMGIAHRNMLTMGIAHRNMLAMGIAHRNMLTMGIAHRNMLTMGIAHRNMLTMGIAHRNMLTMGIAHRNLNDNHRNEQQTMGQSLVKNYMHIVFSTKYRQPLILAPYETELHSYLGGVCKNLECVPIKIGGYTDHVHILCMLSKKIALMKLVEEVKSHSSKWIKTLDASLQNFYWQDGYGAFSVNPAEVHTVINYIGNQHEHHSKRSYQDEYRAFLKKYEVEYDERYVWD